MATKITFQRNVDKNIETLPYVDGQLTYNVNTGETFMDLGPETRVPISPGTGLGIKNAAVKQVIQVLEVDKEGRPIKWGTLTLPEKEAVDRLDLGILNAKLGQTIIIKAVDQETGAPVAWEAVDQKTDLAIKNAHIGDFVQVADITDEGIPTAYKTITVPQASQYKF